MTLKVIIYSVLVVSFLGCDVGDVGSSSSNSTATVTDDESVQNGISECTIECEPVSGGYIFTQVCSGNIIDGPEFAAVLPTGCNVPDSEDIVETEE